MYVYRPQMTDTVTLPVLYSIDPRVDPVSATSRQYIANIGGKSLSYRHYDSVTHNINNTKFHIDLNDFALTSRRVFIKYRIRVDFTAARDGLDVNSGPRCLPLASVIENINMKLAQADYTLTLRRNIHALMHYGSSPEERNRWLCGVPSFFDQFQTYDQVPANLGARNPFALYSTNPTEQTRNAQFWGQFYDGGNNPVDADANGKTYWISGDLFEPLFVEPMNWSERDVVGLNNCDTVDLMLTYSNLSRMWSDYRPDVPAVGNPATQIAGVNWFGPMQLYLVHIAPQDNHPFPAIQYLPYYQLNEWIKTGPLLNAGAETDIYSDVLTFTGIPKRFYIIARENLRDGPVPASIARQTDTFALITNMSIQWGNHPAVLSDADSWDLYNISVRNGNDQTWLQWSRFQGSVLCLVPGTDLPIEADEAPGTATKVNAQFKVHIRNISGNPTTFTLFIIPVEEGYSVNMNKRINHFLNPLSKGQVLTASQSPVPQSGIRNYLGGAWYDDLWSGIKKGLNFGAKLAAPLLPMLSGIPGVGPAISTIGPSVAQGLISATGGRRHRKIRGSGVLSRSELKERADDIV